MWMINPKKMCRKHLLGEHVECHMFLGAIKRNKNLQGYIKNGLLEIESLWDRHEELAIEVIHRGYKHNSPLYVYIDDSIPKIKIDINKNIQDLKNRCKECFKEE